MVTPVVPFYPFSLFSCVAEFMYQHRTYKQELYAQRALAVDQPTQLETLQGDAGAGTGAGESAMSLSVIAHMSDEDIAEAANEHMRSRVLKLLATSMLKVILTSAPSNLFQR